MCLHLKAMALILMFPDQPFRVDHVYLVPAIHVTSPEKPSLATCLKGLPPSLSQGAHVFNACLTPPALPLHERRDCLAHLHLYSQCLE